MIELRSPASSSRARGVLGAAWLLAGSALLVWLLRTPEAALRGELQSLQFWSLETCVFAGLAVAAAVLHDVVSTLPRRGVLAAMALALVAVGLTLTLPLRTHRIFYDEQIYQSIGQNLADSKRAQLCNDGTIQQGRLRCADAEYNKQPYGYPHLLSLAYRTFGVRDAVPFAVNAVAMGLTVLFLYLLVVVLFADNVAALFAALCLALTPEQIIWSASAAAEPSSSLASIAAVLAAAAFIRTPTNTSAAGVAIAAAYAIQFRPESFLIVAVVALLLWQRAGDQLRTPRLWWAGLLFLVLAAVPIAHMAAVRHEGWGTTHERMSIAYVAGNLRVNGWFFLRDVRFPAVFTLLAFAGLGAPRSPAGKTSVVVWFLVFFGVALFFYAGSYDYGADVRYSLAAYPPAMILAGLGASALVHQAGRFTPRPAVALPLAAAIVCQFAWVYLPVVRATIDSAWAPRADVTFARSFAARLPADSYVLTHNPGMFHVWGVNAGQMSLATRAGIVEELSARFPGGVYLHWNFWCNTDDPAQRRLCAEVRDQGPVALAAEFREGDQRFVFYRMIPAHHREPNP